ncbi:MAG: helix-turn-helix transcriptional regulator [Phycisphaerae bacterium]
MAKKEHSLQREFGARVRELRLRANLKQRELASRCGKGFAMQRIGQIERGEMNCTLQTIAALCRGLRCEPIDLFLFPATRGGGEIALPNARLTDLWKAADEQKKAKLLRVLGELL